MTAYAEVCAVVNDASDWLSCICQKEYGHDGAHLCLCGKEF